MYFPKQTYCALDCNAYVGGNVTIYTRTTILQSTISKVYQSSAKRLSVQVPRENIIGNIENMLKENYTS